jgi:hypothetical protein
LLIYLTRKGRDVTGDWKSLTYLDLAAAMRKVWCNASNSPGRAWLSFYLASITQKVLGINVDRLQDVPVEYLATYLGEERT